MAKAKSRSAKKKSTVGKNAPSTKSKHRKVKWLALIAYLANLFIGPGIFIALAIFILKSDDKFIKFHALQSVILSAVFYILAIPVFTALFLFPVYALLLLYGAYMVYKGEKYKFPVIGDFVEEHI